MIPVTIGFLFGVLLLIFQTDLPDSRVVWIAIVLLPAFFLNPRLRFFYALGLGFCWALWFADGRISQHLPKNLENEDIWLEGQVTGIPKLQGTRLQFVFEVERLLQPTHAGDFPKRLLLNWYRDYPQSLRPGERWQLKVRLKRPHGLQNPGGFDYEKWLMQAGIQARGYVRTDPENVKTGAENWTLDGLRFALLEKIHQTLDGHAATGLVQALALGVRHDIRKVHWDALIQTGTNHLIAISGLHIGLVAGFGYWLTSLLWRLSARLCLWLPAAKAAAFFSLVPATIYAAMAGFAVPTQRALIMLSVIVLVTLSQRHLHFSKTVSIALLLVLLFDPLAVLAAGFWLSFAAVILIFWVISRQSGLSGWRGIVLIQLALSLGLLPLIFWFFGQGALYGPIANLVAVPLVGFIIAPLILLGTAMLPFPALPAEALLQLAAWGLQQLLVLLEKIAALPGAYISLDAVSVIAMLLALLAVLLLLAPKGTPGRPLAVWLFLPLFLPQQLSMSNGDFRVTALDVGQGTSVVVETSRHTLVYDTGSAFGARFNMADAAIVPYLRSRARSQVDTLILSHDDADHAGSGEFLLDAMPVRQVMASFNTDAKGRAFRRCESGQSWSWDGVDFKMLHPPAGFQAEDNDMSCVLQVGHGDNQILLTGDITRQVEARLVNQWGDALQSHILLAPHHGSNTSSSSLFLATVAPEYVIFSAGYLNRFGFPRPKVQQRYQQQGINSLRTDWHGAISFHYDRQTGFSPPELFRREERRFWFQPFAAEDSLL